MAVSKSKTKTAKKAPKKAAKKAAKKSTKSAKSGTGKVASTANEKTGKKAAKKSVKKSVKKEAQAKKTTAKKPKKETAAKVLEKSVKKSIAKAKKSSPKPATKSEAKPAPKAEPKAQAQTEAAKSVAKTPAKATAKPQQKPQQKKSKTKTAFGAKAPKGESPKPSARHPATRRHTYRPGKAATPTLKRGEHESKWILIDADGLVLGRLASRVALRLRGKHLPRYTPHINAGDTVIIINASKVALTGNKEKSKVWHRHTGYVGGIKEETPASLRAKAPERMIRLAVSRMLPKGPLASRQLSRLKVYAGADHPHVAQSPEVFDLGAENRKNRA